MYYITLLHTFLKLLNLTYFNTHFKRNFVAGCGAFCAVTQANKHPTDRLMRLKSSPRRASGESEGAFPHTGVTITAAASASVGGLGGSSISALRPVVLVGKGVCYDTGGTDLD